MESLPDIWTASGIALAFIALAATMVTIPRLGRWEPLIAKICFTCAGLIFFGKLISWGVLGLGYGRLPFVGVGAGILAVSLVLCFQWVSERTKPVDNGELPGALDNIVKVECWSSDPPARGREDKTLVVIDFQSLPSPAQNELRGKTGVPFRFDRSSKPYGKGPNTADGYIRCDVTNYSSNPVFDFQTRFELVFQDNVKKEGGVFGTGTNARSGWTYSPKIDLGIGGDNTDHFYFSNSTPYWINIFMPSTASLSLTDGKKIESIKIISKAELGNSVVLLPNKIIDLPVASLPSLTPPAPPAGTSPQMSP